MPSRDCKPLMAGRIFVLLRCLSGLSQFVKTESGARKNDSKQRAKAQSPLLREAGEGREGAARWRRRAERIQDRLIYAVGILQNLVVPKSENAPARCVNPRIARAITPLGIMLAAVSFDDKARSKAGKVGKVRWNRMLPPKVPPIQLFAAQDLPQFPLGRCRLRAQVARAIAHS